MQTRKYRRKTYKGRKYRRKTYKGGNDVYSLKGMKVCGEKFDLYFNEVFASSTFYVYALCKDPELQYCGDALAKVYPLDKYRYINIESVKEEAGYMEKAAELGVAPEFIGLEICTYNDARYAILIMGHYGQGNLTTLLSNGYYEKHKEIIHEKLRVILDALYDENINHNDLHSNNFLYSISNGDIEFKIIDFDTAFPLSLGDRNYKIENIGLSEPRMIDVSPEP
jgi:hypothetical protein